MSGTDAEEEEAAAAKARAFLRSFAELPLDAATGGEKMEAEALSRASLLLGQLEADAATNRCLARLVQAV